jgi:hypothetical protein
MTSPDAPNWLPDSSRLLKWFVAYLALWIPGAILSISELSSEPPPGSTPWGTLLLALSLIVYIVSIVYAYRVQRDLHAAGLYRHGPWNVIVGALILNPFVLGFFIPASVLWTAWRVRRSGKHTTPA